ncbi:MAG TPA: hypothetical protein VGZ48_03960 [Candidatus Acidoferrales bacterium]|nr:hypothetical protein [Candidatus Acidoferrales bacterium]
MEAANLLGEKSARVEFPWKDAGDEYLDLRENAGAITQISVARENPPFARLLLALNEEVSVFRTVRAKVWTADAGDAGAENIFQSRIELIFARDSFNAMPERIEEVVGRLVQLWMKDASADSLSARLEILPCSYQISGRDGAALGITFSARAANAEQARIRWSLGLVRVQQALLFVSREMKQRQGLNT